MWFKWFKTEDNFEVAQEKHMKNITLSFFFMIKLGSGCKISTKAKLKKNPCFLHLASVKQRQQCTIHTAITSISWDGSGLLSLMVSPFIIAILNSLLWDIWDHFCKVDQTKRRDEPKLHHVLAAIRSGLQTTSQPTFARIYSRICFGNRKISNSDASAREIISAEQKSWELMTFFKQKISSVSLARGSSYFLCLYKLLLDRPLESNSSACLHVHHISESNSLPQSGCISEWLTLEEVMVCRELTNNSSKGSS